MHRDCLFDLPRIFLVWIRVGLGNHFGCGRFPTLSSLNSVDLLIIGVRMLFFSWVFYGWNGDWRWDVSISGRHRSPKDTTWGLIKEESHQVLFPEDIILLLSEEKTPQWILHFILVRMARVRGWNSTHMCRPERLGTPWWRCLESAPLRISCWCFHIVRRISFPCFWVVSVS